MADYSKLANDALADLRKVRERWPNYGDSDLERLANALLDLQRERDELVKALEDAIGAIPIAEHMRTAWQGEPSGLILIVRHLVPAQNALAKLKGGSL